MAKAEIEVQIKVLELREAKLAMLDSAIKELQWALELRAQPTSTIVSSYVAGRILPHPYRRQIDARIQELQVLRRVIQEAPESAPSPLPRHQDPVHDRAHELEREFPFPPGPEAYDEQPFHAPTTNVVAPEPVTNTISTPECGQPKEQP